jgi:hypothetical protein
MTWQGEIIDSRIGYRDENAGLRGEPELLPDYNRWMTMIESHLTDD